MRAFKVRVQNGQIVGEAPPGVPEGTELDLCVAEPEEEMSEEELSRLNGALEAAWRSTQAGRTRPASEVLAELRAKR